MLSAELHELTFDGLDLVGRTPYPDGYWFEALSDESSFGASEPITSEQVSGLLNGTLVQLDSWGNRVLEFLVRVRGGNSGVIAKGERELTKRAGDRPKVLSFTPPDGWGARTDYDVLVTAPEFLWDDFAERDLSVSGRVWKLTLTCGPFGLAAENSTTQVGFPAPVSPSTTTISDGTAATNWTSDYGSVTVVSGQLDVPGVVNFGAADVYYVSSGTEGRWCSFQAKRSGLSQSLASLKFVRAEFTALTGGSTLAYLLEQQVRLVVNGTRSFHPIAYEAIGADGKGLRVWWYADGITTATSLDFSGRVVGYRSDGAIPTSPPAIRLDNVAVTNVPPSITTGYANQTYGVLASTGSAPSAGTIRVSHPSSDLGNTIVYTAPVLELEGAAYRPDCLRWGADPLIPQRTLPPGTYVFVMLNGGSTLTFQTKAANGTTDIGSSTTVTGTQGIFPSTWVTGSITLPLVDVPTRDTSTFLKIDNGTSGPTELWLFWMGDGAALTIAKEVTDKNLFLQHPQVGDTTPGIFTGDEADMSDAIFPGDKVIAWDQHRIDPAGTTVHVVTTGAVKPTVEFVGRPAFHGFAAGD